MKKISLILISLTILIGCSKDHNSAPSTNPSNYELVAYTGYLNGDIPGEYDTLLYNPGTHLLSSYKKVNYAIGKSDTINYQLAYTDGKCTRIDVDSLGYHWYYTFQYNSDAEVDTVQLFNQNGSSLNQFWVFHYNAAGELFDASAFVRDTIVSHYSYNYDASGNVSDEIDSLFSRPLYIGIAQYSNYDNRINPIKAVPGYPFTILPLNAFGISNASRNNYEMVAWSSNTPIPGTTDNIGYLYNAAGLPTHVGPSSGGMNYTYRSN